MKALASVEAPFIVLRGQKQPRLNLHLIMIHELAYGPQTVNPPLLLLRVESERDI